MVLKMAQKYLNHLHFYLITTVITCHHYFMKYSILQNWKKLTEIPFDICVGWVVGWGDGGICVGVVVGAVARRCARFDCCSALRALIEAPLPSSELGSKWASGFVAVVEDWDACKLAASIWSDAGFIIIAGGSPKNYHLPKRNDENWQCQESK